MEHQWFPSASGAKGRKEAPGKQRYRFPDAISRAVSLSNAGRIWGREGAGFGVLKLENVENYCLYGASHILFLIAEILIRIEKLTINVIFL